MKQRKLAGDFIRASDVEVCSTLLATRWLVYYPTVLVYYPTVLVYYPTCKLAQCN